MVVSNTSYHQCHLESSARQRELFSSINNTVVPQLSVLRDYLASSKPFYPEHQRRSPFLTVRWTQKRVFHFLFFDILIRTNDLRRHGRFIQDEKQYRQASSILLRFNPSTLLAWLVETTVILDMCWGNTVDGLKINPRYYVQVPDSHHIMKAARTGNMSLVRNLISTNSASTLCVTSAGWTPLHVSYTFLEQKELPREANSFPVCCCQRSPGYV